MKGGGGGDLVGHVPLLIKRPRQAEVSKLELTVCAMHPSPQRTGGGREGTEGEEDKGEKKAIMRGTVKP